MKHLALLPLLLALALLPGCGKTDLLGHAPDTDTGPVPPFGDELIRCSDLAYEPTGEFDVESVEMDDDDFVIEVAYGGGCEEHDWVLCWPEMTWLADYGPIPLVLLHEHNGDYCQAYIHEILRFDVSAIAEWIGDDNEWALCLVFYPESCDLTNPALCMPEELDWDLCVWYET